MNKKESLGVLHLIWIVLYCITSVFGDLVHSGCDKIYLNGTLNSPTFEGSYTVQMNRTCVGRPVYIKDKGERRYLLYVGYGWIFTSWVSNGGCYGNSRIQAKSNVALPNVVTEVWTETDSDYKIEVPSIQVHCLDIHIIHVCQTPLDNPPECDVGTVIHSVQASYGSSPTMNISSCTPHNTSCQVQMPTHDDYYTHILEACNGRRKCTDLKFDLVPLSNCQLSSYCDPDVQVTNYVSLQYQCLRNTGCDKLELDLQEGSMYSQYAGIYLKTFSNVCYGRNVYKLRNSDIYIWLSEGNRNSVWSIGNMFNCTRNGFIATLSHVQYPEDIDSDWFEWNENGYITQTNVLSCVEYSKSPTLDCTTTSQSTLKSTTDKMQVTSTLDSTTTSQSTLKSTSDEMEVTSTATSFTLSTPGQQSMEKSINTTIVAAVCASVLGIVIIASIVAVVVVKRKKNKSEPSSNLNRNFHAENNIYFDGRNVVTATSVDGQITPEHNSTIPENINTENTSSAYELAGNDNPVYEMAGSDEPRNYISCEDMTPGTPESEPNTELYTLPNKDLRYDDDLVVQDNTNYHSYDTQGDNVIIEENPNYHSVPEQYDPCDDTIVEDNINYHTFEENN